MTVIDLIIRGSKAPAERIVALAVLAGISNTTAIIIVNNLVVSPSEPTLVDLAAFVVSLVISLVSIRGASHRVITAVETSLHQLKTRIIDKVRRAELVEFEGIGRSEIFEGISQNLWVISLAASLLGVVIQAMSVFVLALAYLAWLSPTVFAYLAPLLVAGILIYRARQREVIGWLARRSEARFRFLDRLRDILQGSKEIRLNRARARDISAHFDQTSAEQRDISVEVTVRWDDSQLFLSANLFVMLAFLVFVFAKYLTLEGELVGQLVVALMFAWGSVQASVFGYTKYVEANRALVELTKLEAKLEGGGQEEGAELDVWPRTGGGIEVRAIEYSYPASGGDPGFRLGPLDLEIHPGEVLFIVGGNGAGKSTLLKLLTGLYAPQRGMLRVGGVTVGPHNVAAYRESLSVILTDVHLFKRVYGLLDADPVAVAELLGQLGIDNKTEFVAGRFTKLMLSTGQRKRLAMVLAMLEERPIMILDEWAADQDPEFRKYFYEQMIPSLKRRGKTVIAVSHDDRYFDRADRVIVLEYGELRST